MSAAPAIRDPKAAERQKRHRERLRMEKLGVRYVDAVPMMREVIGAAVVLGLMNRAAFDDDLRAAADIASLMDRAVALASKHSSVAEALKLPK